MTLKKMVYHVDRLFQHNRPIATLPQEFMSAMRGGLNGSAQHSILKGNDGVLQCVEVSFEASRRWKKQSFGSLAAGRVAESDWASVW
jgi:hypothetical protein